MMFKGKVQLSDFILDHENITDLCQSLKNNEVTMLSLRQCQMKDNLFKHLTQAIGRSKSLLQLMLTNGMVSSQGRIEMLAHALFKNKSVSVLGLYGNPVGDDGMKLLTQGLQHHELLSLDLGSCNLGDGAIQYICQLLVASKENNGLKCLSLSANPEITAQGWAQLSMVLCQCPALVRLSVDYSSLGPLGGSCLMVGLAANHNVEELDLERTGITEDTAQLLLHLLNKYTSNLTQVHISGNEIKKVTQDAIRNILSQRCEELSDSEPSESDIFSRQYWSRTCSVASGIESTSDSELTSSTTSTVHGSDEEDDEEEERAELTNEMAKVLTAHLTDESVAPTTQENLMQHNTKANFTNENNNTGKQNIEVTKKKGDAEEADESEGEELMEVPVYSDNPVWPTFN